MEGTPCGLRSVQRPGNFRRAPTVNDASLPTLPLARFCGACAKIDLREPLRRRAESRPGYSWSFSSGGRGKDPPLQMPGARGSLTSGLLLSCNSSVDEALLLFYPFETPAARVGVRHLVAHIAQEVWIGEQVAPLAAA